ncbi:MAG: PfkB family carbohydrate kinase [Chitinophagales bacterium]
MNKKHKIAVVGPIPKDHITTHKGLVVEKYGCITHPTIALSKLLKDSGYVYPIAHISQSHELPIHTIFSAYKNIVEEGVSSVHDQGTVIKLRFVDQNNRLEKQIAYMHPIIAEDMAVALDADVFVFVPITDFEVPLETLKYLKANSKGLIIFDAHGPTSTATTKGDRYRRFWIDRDLWLPYIDVLKMNIEEAGCCWFPKEIQPKDLEDDYIELSEKQRADFAEHVLSKGVKAVYITLDSRGCAIYTMKNGQMQQDFVPSVRVSEVIDTTGCGDSFAGGLAFGLLEDKTDYIKAAQYANALGAQRTQGTTFEVFKSLEETNEMIRKNYGDQSKV